MFFWYKFVVAFIECVMYAMWIAFLSVCYSSCYYQAHYHIYYAPFGVIVFFAMVYFANTNCGNCYVVYAIITITFL